MTFVIYQYVQYWLFIMVKKAMKRALFWVLAFYLVSALGFGYGHAHGSSKNDPTVTVEAVQAGLSWPWLVVQAAADRPS